MLLNRVLNPLVTFNTTKQETTWIYIMYTLFSTSTS